MIALRSSERRCPQGVEHCEQVDSFLKQRPKDRGEEPRRGKPHPEHAQRHSTNGAFERDLAHVAADVKKLVYLSEGRLKDNRPCGFGGYVATRTERHTDSGGRQRWRDPAPAGQHPAASFEVHHHQRGVALLGDDRAVAATYAAGAPVYVRPAAS